MSAPKRILVVDDLNEVRRPLARLLRSKGYETFEADSGISALATLDRETVDLVVTDDNMPKHHDGVLLISYLADKGVVTPVILHSGFPLEVINADCREKGIPTAAVKHYVQKGETEALIALVKRLLG